jgi:hypothetical protein
MTNIQPSNQPQQPNLPPNPQQVRVDALGASAPCPSCGNTQTGTVGFTWWGGIVGPRIFNVVRCLNCGTQYNGKKGTYLGKSIAMYYGIVFGIVILFAIIGAMAK